MLTLARGIHRHGGRVTASRPVYNGVTSVVSSNQSLQSRRSLHYWAYPSKPQSLINQIQLRRESSLTNDGTISEKQVKQARAPWHREGSDMKPVAKQRSAGVMTKGTYTLMTN